MTPQELKKMSRTDLVQLVLQQERSMDAMQSRIINMERQQRERSFQMKKFGSLAEASLQLNGVFEAAQRAANQYLESAAQLSAACKQQKLESDRLLSQTKEACARLEEETRRRCREMLEKAETDAKTYWGSMEQDLLKHLEDYVPEWHGTEPELLESILSDPEETEPETVSEVAAEETGPEVAAEETGPEEIAEETEPEAAAEETGPEEIAEETEAEAAAEETGPEEIAEETEAEAAEEETEPEEIAEETEPEVTEEETVPQEVLEETELEEILEESGDISEGQFHSMIEDDLDLDEFKRLIGDL